MGIRIGLFAVAAVMLSGAPAKAWWWSGPVAAACKDDTVERAPDYNPSSRSGVAGSFKRIEFRPDHTVLVVSGYESVEACGILPPRAELERLGLNVSGWKPGRVVMISGISHLKDDRRIWVERVTDEATGEVFRLRPQS